MSNKFHEKTIEKLKYELMTFILSWSGLMVLMSMFITIPLTTVFKRNSISAQQNPSGWGVPTPSVMQFAVCCTVHYRINMDARFF